MTDWGDITKAIGLALGGDKHAGRDALLACWAVTTAGDHAQRCVLAHYLADLQSSLDDEVAWDEVALSEHAHVVDENLAPVAVASAALAPSLHLNLGDGYLRQGRVGDARTQLVAGMQAGSSLPPTDMELSSGPVLSASRSALKPQRTADGTAAKRFDPIGSPSPMSMPAGVLRRVWVPRSTGCVDDPHSPSAACRGCRRDGCRV